MIFFKSVFTLLAFLQPISSTILQQSPVKFIPGLIIEEETGQILYEATAPIIYQFETPNWNDFIAVPIDDCPVSDLPEFCSTYEVLKSISKNLYEAIVPSSLSLFQEETIQSTWGLKCNYISQHFSSIRVDATVVQKYMGFLRSCSRNGTILEEDLISKHAQKPDLKAFENMSDIFASEFLSKFDLNGDYFLQKASHFHLKNSLLSTGFTTFVSEAMRWADAITTCKSGKIPSTLIPSDVFFESLTKLNATVSENGWKFAVIAEKQFLPLFYKNNLADCTFSGKTFIVRVLLPILKVSRNWTHLSSTVVPFYQKSSAEGEGIYTVKQASNVHIGSYFYEKITRRLFRARNCNSDVPGFCRLPDVFDSSSLDIGSCLWSSLQDPETNDYMKYCTERDWTVLDNYVNLPLVTKKESDTFILTGSPSMNMSVECSEFDGSISGHSFGYPLLEGSLEVVLPCNCRVLIHENVVEPDAPCKIDSTELLVNEVLPTNRTMVSS